MRRVGFPIPRHVMDLSISPSRPLSLINKSLCSGQSFFGQMTYRLLYDRCFVEQSVQDRGTRRKVSLRCSRDFGDAGGAVERRRWSILYSDFDSRDDLFRQTTRELAWKLMFTW